MEQEEVVVEEQPEVIEEEPKSEKEPNKILEFFRTTLNGTAYGLFATLIVGTIIGTIGLFFSYGAGNPFCDFMSKILGSKTGLAFVLQLLTGAGIGTGIALALKFDPLKTIILAAVGQLSAFFSLSTSFVTNPNIDHALGAIYTASGTAKVGDPLTIYFVCICTALLIQLVFRKKTPVDIIIIPLFGGVVGLILSLAIRYPTIYITYAIQWLVDNGTRIMPFLMGIVIAVLMGMALTAPISSAAIAAVVFSTAGEPTEGLLIASGAAVVGCSAQMIGFAIQSRKDNPIGTVISIGIGTSMLQFKNIIKKPVIWLPTIIASAILGPISTCWLRLVCMGANAGMGTAGLVGQIGTISSMGVESWQAWVGIFGLQIIAPAILVFFIDLLFRKLGWIKEGDLKI